MFQHLPSSSSTRFRCSPSFEPRSFPFLRSFFHSFGIAPLPFLFCSWGIISLCSPSLRLSSQVFSSRARNRTLSVSTISKRRNSIQDCTYRNTDFFTRKVRYGDGEDLIGACSRPRGADYGNVNSWEQPQLVIGGKILSYGEDWTSYGPAQSGIAYVL